MTPEWSAANRYRREEKTVSNGLLVASGFADHIQPYKNTKIFIFLQHLPTTVQCRDFMLAESDGWLLLASSAMLFFVLILRENTFSKVHYCPPQITILYYHTVSPLIIFPVMLWNNFRGKYKKLRINQSLLQAHTCSMHSEKALFWNRKWETLFIDTE